jgi:hypothetical protein
MYLLYADDSGDLSNPATTHFVVAGIAVHEDAIRPFAGHINGTINRFVGKQLGMKVEIHGNPMRFGAGEWKNVSETKRLGLARELLKSCREWGHKESDSTLHPFVVALDQGFSLSPTETAYGELLQLFDGFLRASRRGGTPHNGVLVADRGRYQRALEAYVDFARARRPFPRQQRRRLHALAETPFFVDSKATRLVQIADILAYAFYRGYSANDWSWAEDLGPALVDANPSRLVHFTADKQCKCLACGHA